MKKLVRNRIKCNLCGDVIESKHRHDFVTCRCGCVSVDGDLDYARRCFIHSKNDYTDLSEYAEEKQPYNSFED